MRFCLQTAIKDVTKITSLIAVFCSVCLIGCEKDADRIGKELLPGVGVVRYDGAKTSLVSQLNADTVPTFNRPFSLIGEIDDPQFGKQKADLYAQFTLTGSNKTFVENEIRLDSVRLMMYLLGPYGDSTATLSWEAYELAESIQADTLYEITDSLLTQGPELTENAPVRPFNKNGELVSIPLSDAFGQKLLSAPASALVDNASFLAYFKGLKVGVRRQTGRGRAFSIFQHIDLQFPNKIRLYYRFRRGDEYVAAHYDFPLGADSRYFHSFRRTTTGNELVRQIQTDPVLANAKAVLQAGVGSRVHLKFDGLDSLAGNPVNQAFLTLYVDSSYYKPDNFFTPPRNLWLFSLKSDGTPADREFAAAPYDPTIGGYVFRIDAYIQGVNAGSIPNDGLFVYADLPALPVFLTYSLDRVVFQGAGSPRPPKLSVYYTRIPRLN